MAKEKKKVNDAEFKKLKENLKTKFVNAAHIMWGRDLDELSENEIYQAVAAVAKTVISENWIK
ncbi:MAG: hypothetical protein IIZ87_01755, partial [Selenomonas sp.]|nr:hypothetical protein [Selenomonas sp.]